MFNLNHSACPRRLTVKIILLNLVLEFEIRRIAGTKAEWDITARYIIICTALINNNVEQPSTSKSTLWPPCCVKSKMEFGQSMIL
jgi:hypothetical protein